MGVAPPRTMAPPLLERLGVERPIVQAGMGGGLSGHELAAAVSEAGGLGTIGMLDPSALARELAAARALTSRPLAVNLLLPFARPAHWDAAASADVVVTFWGTPRRGSATTWLHQCGSVEEALAAAAAGADGVVLQGIEAGGHVRGTTPAHDLLGAARGKLPPNVAVLLAGGLADAADVADALSAGAEAAVLGTRFVMTPESGAHPRYRHRLVEGRTTLLTELFGLGWPGAHRVLPNHATERWLGGDPRGPAWLRASHRLSAPALARLPLSVQGRASALQHPRLPLLAPLPPTAGGPARLVEAGPLYAGQTVARIDDVRPAGELTVALTP
jgi:NAD(P)H-dependent flavin oxidoreductase YrpB (nitropropane dioxygenase family)